MTPQWQTAERLAKLDELGRRDGYLCLKGHPNCLEITHYQWAIPHQEAVAVPREHLVHDKSLDVDGLACSWNDTRPKQVTVWEWLPVDHLADATCAETIASWKADDREKRALDWKREQQAILDGTYGRYGSRFDPVARDVFMAQRPEYYLKATGMDGMHFRPVAVVRVPSQNIYLYVDVSAAFKKTTKGQRRHARRHGKAVQEVMVTVEQLCQQAIGLWWTRVRQPFLAL